MDSLSEFAVMRVSRRVTITMLCTYVTISTSGCGGLERRGKANTIKPAALELRDKLQLAIPPGADVASARRFLKQEGFVMSGPEIGDMTQWSLASDGTLERVTVEDVTFFQALRKFDLSDGSGSFVVGIVTKEDQKVAQIVIGYETVGL